MFQFVLLVLKSHNCHALHRNFIFVDSRGSEGRAWITYKAVGEFLRLTFLVYILVLGRIYLGLRTNSSHEALVTCVN